MIETLVWVLPRPRRTNKYVGGFPLHFEKKLFKLYGMIDKPLLTGFKKILQPFGGMAEYGDRIDLNIDLKPKCVADAHYLCIKNNSYDFVLLDPPYSIGLSGKLYKTGKLAYKKYIREAVRVCKPGGYIAMYHWYITPRPEGTKYHRRIFIGTRIWHHIRVCTIFEKL